MSNYDKIVKLINSNFSSFAFNLSDSHLNDDGANYSGTERVYAGYLMNSISFGKSRFQNGRAFRGHERVLQREPGKRKP